MSGQAISYNSVASTYDARFKEGAPEGIYAALLTLARTLRATYILEVGCGTGQWLTFIHHNAPNVYGVTPSVFGLDVSFEMLQQAQRRDEALLLIQGHAIQLPFRAPIFDVVISINSIHLFGDINSFILQARQLLHSGGALAIIAIDPHLCTRDDWYVYKYFEGTYEYDLATFPSAGDLLDSMTTAGFNNVDWRIVHRGFQPKFGREVLHDYFLQKGSISQLMRLNEKVYQAGLQLINDSLNDSEAQSELLLFPTNTPFFMIVGHV